MLDIVKRNGFSDRSEAVKVADTAWKEDALAKPSGFGKRLEGNDFVQSQARHLRTSRSSAMA